MNSDLGPELVFILAIGCAFIGVCIWTFFEVRKGRKYNVEQKTLAHALESARKTLDYVLYQAVASQYFGETHKHRAHLWDIMDTIDPEMTKLYDQDPGRAFTEAAKRIGLESADA